MGGGGGGTSTQYVKSETSNIPAYAQPYFTGLLNRADSALKRDYQPYDQERIAGFTPQQQQVQSNILNQQTPGQFGQASDATGLAALGTVNGSQYNPTQFHAQQVRPQGLNYFQMQGPQSFLQGDNSSQYMNPYTQGVIDVTKDQAIRDAKQGQLVADLGAARQGTYGGSRQLLAGMERERNLGQNLSNIEATGMQKAYENAQQQFNTEQQQQQQAGQQNLNAALGVQQLGAQNSLAAQQANQQYGLEAQRLGEQSNQFGANLGLQGMAQLGQLGQTMGNLGQMQSQADMARLNQQQGVAAQQQGLNQQYLDTAYQDFLRQQNYPNEQMSLYSSILHGIPVTPNTTSTTSAPSPSLASQIMGTGLGALGMYNSLKG